ncbi:MAG: hypothetical protein COC06_07075 [Bacteroidales bacterium]|nr:MAG: hypothetical protein COC06_07075 [Bacteroidales bacterium]
MKHTITLIALTLLTTVGCFAQFTLDGEFRPRTEYRNGFGSLIDKNDDPGFATSTRTRLNFGYNTEMYNFYLSLQDVMVWGENRQLRPDDENNSFAIFEAWANVKLSDHFSTKIGRQTLVYDDQRILGAVNWAQQARNHDAVVLKYKKDKLIIDVGLAYNQDYDHATGYVNSGNTYNTKGFFSYKTMQYAYLKTKGKELSASLLLLNNGFQNFNADNAEEGDGVSNLQTIGTHLDYKKGKFGAAANIYLQTGERQGEIDVKGAYLASLDFSFKASKKISLGLGAEIISGNDESAGKTGAFFPLYGTNHKFNGFMDYFYVGNHANSVGLIDIHASANFNLGNNSSLLVKVLNFSGEQDLPSGENALGTEVDIVFSKKFKTYTVKAGYSHMFAADGMYELKNLSEDLAADSQSWAWVMLVIKPKFFSSNLKK